MHAHQRLSVPTACACTRRLWRRYTQAELLDAKALEAGSGAVTKSMQPDSPVLKK